MNVDSPVRSRREFLRQGGVGALAFWIGGCEVEVTPEEARRQGADFRILTAGEVAAIDALGETLVPGSAEAGLAHFIDSQLAGDQHSSLLMIRYLGANPPFTDFYRGGLAAIDALARAEHGPAFAGLDRERRAGLVGEIAAANPDGWQGPPAPFFYFVLRNDAVDVVYGTKAGVEGLGVPYMAHIEPPAGWNA